MDEIEQLTLEAEQLVRAAQIGATGATIHQINSFIGAIRGTAIAYRQGYAVRAELEQWMKILREYMAHGDYKRAMRENPPPKGWRRPQDYVS